MKVQTHMYAAAAGALLMTLVGTSAMGADGQAVMSNHTKGLETVVDLGETKFSFMAMQSIPGTPMSDEELSTISGQRMNLNFLKPQRDWFLDLKRHQREHWTVPGTTGPRLIIRNY